MLNEELMKRKPQTGNKFIYRYWDDEGSYIGQTKVSLKSRAGKNGKSYCDKDSKWSRAISEKGFDHFNVEILCECLEADADKEEKKYIKQFDSRRHGYNTTPGGAYYNPAWGNNNYAKYLKPDMIDEILKPNNFFTDDFISWYNSLNENQYEKYLPQDPDEFEKVISAIDKCLYNRKIRNIYTQLGLTYNEIEKLLKIKGKCISNDRNRSDKLLEDYKFINSVYRCTQYADLEDFYSEDTYNLYRHKSDKNKIAISQYNYMPGGGHDLWVTFFTLK